MHARKAARDAYFPTRSDDAFFSARGDVVLSDSGTARRFADRLAAASRAGTQAGTQGRVNVPPAELAAMVLVHEVFHVVLELYRGQRPDSFHRLRDELERRIGDDAREALRAFLRAFPTPAIYKHFQGEGDAAPDKVLHDGGQVVAQEFTDEVLLLWLVNQNPAYEPVRTLVTDEDLGPSYRSFVGEVRRFFDADMPFGPRGETLLDLLLAPSRAAPGSIFDQLAFIEGEWGRALGLDRLPIWRRLLWAHAFLAEEGRWFLQRGRGPGPGEPLLDAMRFSRLEDEPKRFSPDLDWMPHVVLLAKTVYVWLDQLSKKYERHVHRLDQIPDEELDLLASRGFTGLWLIGLFERSRASRKIKQMRGDPDAVASAYSLRSYTIAEELGGYGAYENLKQRAWRRGIRLAADMVPNHVGIDGDWVIEHPNWFLQTPHPPYPSYRFGGPDLSEDPRVGAFIEEGYWSHTDAAVVFRRHDRWTSQDTFIYHGNDGTNMPWNDTAQLDYTLPEVRRAVVETILHVARLFPIIRFDAAMTLAKRHYKRLWFPAPGATDCVPSRADYAMSQEEFDRIFPVEFWREVVDTVKARAPDTLLLAEAFWMMEGYFVRSLGMHRVYNSAFMNMLKREENEKYRETIKNVLDFDPEILKRFVNFMNNPDEETAIAQFGSDDKYFGVCTMMATMPGLPMFGHGQIEGLHEKYGMEYRRAKWDERPSEWLVRRHEREIFPLLKKRWLFSGVEGFALYDFFDDEGRVCQDVFAYSNREGRDGALVLFHNKYGRVRGRVQHSSGKRGEDGRWHASALADAIGLDPSQGDWLVFRDVPAGLDYIRPMREVIAQGLSWDLLAFKYHVFEEFRGVVATDDKPYDRLAAELAGRGVPSIERAVTELYFRPLHAPLRTAIGEGHLGYLAKGWNEEASAPADEALAALVEHIEHVADGLAYMTGRESIETEDVLEAARARYRGILALAHAKPKDARAIHLTSGATAAAAAAPSGEAAAAPSAEAKEAAGVEAAAGADAATERGADVAGVSATDIRLLSTWLHLAAALDLIAKIEPDAPRAELATRWELAMPLGDVEPDHGRAALVLLAATLPDLPMRDAMRVALDDPRGRAYLRVHEAGGVAWLVKEPFEALAEILAEREAASGRASLELARRQAADVVAVATSAGWRVKELAGLAKKEPAKGPEAPASEANGVRH